MKDILHQNTRCLAEASGTEALAEKQGRTLALIFAHKSNTKPINSFTKFKMWVLA